jgi:putative nucleotidyltransferase with HDIG domain
MSQDIEKLVAKVGDLPAVPSIVSQVAHLVEDPDSSVEDLRRVLENDPALAARILKLANSAIFGFSRRIETLQHAISLVGFRSVKTMVMAASIKGVFKRFGLTERMLWEHSTMAGAVASQLAGYGEIDIDREEAFTVGLLHDLGKIALNNTCEKEYNEVVSRVYNDGLSFVAAEREIFGFDHAELGALVASKWKLSQRLETAIRCHHSPAEMLELADEEKRLTALAVVTTAACTRLGIGRRAPVSQLDLTTLEAWSVLGLGPQDVEPVLSLALDQVKESSGLFD